MRRLNALPADLDGWTGDDFRAADAQYHARAKELLSDGHEKMSAADLEELHICNNALEDIRSPVRGAIHPPDRSSRPGVRRGLGSIGEAFIKGMTRDKMFAVIDGTTGGTTVPSYFDSQFRQMPSRRLFLRSILGAAVTAGDKVDYVRQTVQTHAAAAVAAGALKPTSTYTVERVTANVQTIAHVTEAIDRALLSDFDQLSQFLDEQLRIGVLLEEEDQILNGSGTPPNLRGILNTVGIQTQAKGADPTVDAFYKAVTKIRDQFFEPDAVVMHPTDWQDIRLTRTADGEYIWGDPAEKGQESLWGLPVVTSSAIAANTALVGAFAAGATVYDREQARVTFAETGLSDSAGEEMFTRNEIRFRGESRLAFAVAFPAAFCTVTGV